MYDGVTTNVRTQGGVRREFPITIGQHHGQIWVFVDMLIEHVKDQQAEYSLIVWDRERPRKIIRKTIKRMYFNSLNINIIYMTGFYDVVWSI